MLHFYSPLSLPLRRWIPFLYTVWLGSIDIGHSNTGVKYHVFRIVIHPKHHSTTADIALLRQFSRVTYSSSILPICWSSVKKQWTIPDSCWVTRWGKAEDEGENGKRKGLFYTSPSCTHSRIFIF